MAKKYIDADKLRAEVERLYKQNEGDFDNGCYNEDQRCGYDIALLDLRMILDSLQQEQPEVDLEAEIEKAGKDVLRQAHYRNKIFDIPQTMFDDVQLMDIFKSGVYKGYELGKNSK